MKKALLITVTIVTILNVLNMYWWIKTAWVIVDFKETLAEYLSVFPEFLRNGRTITYITLTSTVACLVGIFYVLEKRNVVLTIPLFILNSLLFLFMLWSLM